MNKSTTGLFSKLQVVFNQSCPTAGQGGVIRSGPQPWPWPWLTGDQSNSALYEECTKFSIVIAFDAAKNVDVWRHLRFAHGCEEIYSCFFNYLINPLHIQKNQWNLKFTFTRYHLYHWKDQYTSVRCIKPIFWLLTPK